MQSSGRLRSRTSTIVMRRHLRMLRASLPLFVGLYLTSIALVGAAEVTPDLVEARLDALRAGGAGDADELLNAYETAQDWFVKATSHSLDADNYLDAMALAPEREREIQARINTLEMTEAVTPEMRTLSRKELEAELKLTRTELREAMNALDAIERRLAARETTAELDRTRLEEIARRLDEMGSVESTGDLNAPPSMDEASKWVLKAEQHALIAERRALEARLTSQPGRFAVLHAEGAELSLRIEKLTEKTRGLTKLARGKLLAVAGPEVSGIDPDSPVYAIADRLTSENRRLRERRLEVEARLDATSVTLTELEEINQALDERFRTAQRVVEFASDSDVLGEVLLAYWQEIESFRLSKPTGELSKEVGDTVISRINHEKEQARLISASRYIAAQIEAAGLAPRSISEADESTLVELARSKRELLRRMISVESNYIDALSEFKAGRARQERLVDEYEEYLGGLVLWIPSRQLLWKSDLAEIPAEFGRLWSALKELGISNRALFLVGLLIAAALVYFREGLREIQHAQNSRISKPREDSVRFTLFAVLLTGLRALPVPLLVFAIALLFSQDTSPAAAALSNTLGGVAAVLFSLAFVRALCEESGVARMHFDWRPQVCDRLCTGTNWLIRWWIPIAALASFLFMMNDETILLGRLTLLLALLLLAGHIVDDIRRDWQIHGRQCLSTNQNRVRLMLVAFLVLVMAGIAWGLRYSVSIVTSRLLVTLWVGLSLLILHDLLIRWLSVTRRRLRLAELLAHRKEQAAGESGIESEEQVDLITIGTETKQLLRAAATLAALVALLYIWAPLLPVFDALSRVTLWTSTAVAEGGESVTTRISLETLIVVSFLLGITFYAARKLPALVELVLRSRTRITPGARYTTNTLLSYIIVGAGIVAALATLGVRWSQLQWLIAALGVGIGFGLQEIVANFISGLIILFERPIRVGDIVTVGDKDGTVTRIRIRATTILDFDGKELLVPNKEFITGRLLNWTLSDSSVRLIVPVGIAYGSDVGEAIRILGDITDANPAVLDEPAPSIIFENFGDNSVELTARFFIKSFDDYWPVNNEVRCEIYKRFAEAGIEIAFPQRDVHFDSERPIRVAIAPAREQ